MKNQKTQIKLNLIRKTSEWSISTRVLKSDFELSIKILANGSNWLSNECEVELIFVNCNTYFDNFEFECEKLPSQSAAPW